MQKFESDQNSANLSSNFLTELEAIYNGDKYVAVFSIY